MNCQVDIVVIGDSVDGRKTVAQLASNRPTIKVVFISREFKSTTTHDYINVEYIKDEVIFTDYKNRLFGCYLKNGDRIFCTHLIIATGLAYEPLKLNNKHVPCVFNTADDIPKSAKNTQAIVIGNQNSDVKFALAVAKKYKYVYLCTNELTIENVTAANVKKLAETDNIAVLPNASLLKIYATDNVLQKVELDNYSTITCSAIYAKTTTIPETTFLPNNIISKNADGYLRTTNHAQSILVPKCFAIGSCAEKSTKSMKVAMIESVLSDFNGGTL